MVTAKICGLSTPETLDAALRGGASHVGFVFFRKSPRHVSMDRAAMLASRVLDSVGRVGVFVDPDDGLLRSAISAGRLSAVQIHNASFHRLHSLGPVLRELRVDLWAAISVRRASDIVATKDLGPEIDRIIFDAKTADDALLPGGMGLRFDWAMLRGHRHQSKWGLAGGLHSSNVGAAVAITGATLVDVSSGVESAPGVKDVDKIAAFLHAVAAL